MRKITGKLTAYRYANNHLWEMLVGTTLFVLHGEGEPKAERTFFPDPMPAKTVVGTYSSAHSKRRKYRFDVKLEPDDEHVQLEFLFCI